MGIKAEDGIGADGTVWEEAVTDLQWEGGKSNSAREHSQVPTVNKSMSIC